MQIEAWIGCLEQNEESATNLIEREGLLTDEGLPLAGSPRV